MTLVLQLRIGTVLVLGHSPAKTDTICIEDGGPSSRRSRYHDGGSQIYRLPKRRFKHARFLVHCPELPAGYIEPGTMQPDLFALEKDRNAGEGFEMLD